jgi:hypothetical protein
MNLGENQNSLVAWSNSHIINWTHPAGLVVFGIADEIRYHLEVESKLPNRKENIAAMTWRSSHYQLHPSC